MTENKPTENELIEKFYSKPFLMSYSGLNKLLYSPSLFYRHYILQEREDKTDSYLIDGKVIHCLLLNDGSFDEQFIMLPSVLPTGNSRLVVDKVFEIHKNGGSADISILAQYPQDILDVLKEINLHQSLKTDQQRLDKILTEDTKSYFEFLKQKGNKDLIDSETMTRCSEAVEILRKHPEVSNLLALLRNDMDNIEVYNEFYIEVLNTNVFGLKGIVDSIVIDHDKKIVRINDLKTTGKSITDFKETIEFYNYWLQAAMYHLLVSQKFPQYVSEYKFVFNFIVIDKYQQVYPFEVSTQTMTEWSAKMHEKLQQAYWHYINRNYKLPYEFANGKIIL